MSSFRANLLSGAAAICAAGVAFSALSSDQETDDKNTNYQVIGSLVAGVATYVITTGALNVCAWMEGTNAAPVVQKNRNALIQCGGNENIRLGLLALYDAAPALVTLENQNTLIQCGKNAEHVARGLINLRNTHPTLITQENFNALIQSGENAEDVALGLAILYRANPALATPENRNALIQSGENVRYVVRGFLYLCKVRYVVRGFRYPCDCDDAIHIGRRLDLLHLHWIHPALASQENINALIQSGKNAEHFAKGFDILYCANPAPATPENLDALLQSGKNAHWVAWALKHLHNASPALVTPENRNALIRSGENAEWVRIGLATLYYANRALITQDNLDALIQGGENAENIAQGLVVLHNANPALVTPENRNALLAGNGVRAGKFLQEVESYLASRPGPLTQEAFNSIMRTIDEREWQPCRNAAAILAQRNRLVGDNPQNPRLPPELIGKIAGYISPDLPKPLVERRAWDVASKIEQEVFKSHSDEPKEYEEG